MRFRRAEMHFPDKLVAINNTRTMIYSKDTYRKVKLLHQLIHKLIHQRNILSICRISVLIMCIGTQNRSLPMDIRFENILLRDLLAAKIQQIKLLIFLYLPLIESQIQTSK